MGGGSYLAAAGMVIQVSRSPAVPSNRSPAWTLDSAGSYLAAPPLPALAWVQEMIALLKGGGVLGGPAKDEEPVRIGVGLLP